jgi:hypothetical protein
MSYIRYGLNTLRNAANIGNNVKPTKEIITIFLERGCSLKKRQVNQLIFNLALPAPSFSNTGLNFPHLSSLPSAEIV